MGRNIIETWKKQVGEEGKMKICLDVFIVHFRQMTQMKTFRKMGYIPVSTCQRFGHGLSWSFAQNVK